MGRPTERWWKHLTAVQPESYPPWLLLLINTPYNNYAFYKQHGFESMALSLLHRSENKLHGAPDAQPGGVVYTERLLVSVVMPTLNREVSPLQNSLTLGQPSVFLHTQLHNTSAAWFGKQIGLGEEAGLTESWNCLAGILFKISVQPLHKSKAVLTPSAWQTTYLFTCALI